LTNIHKRKSKAPKRAWRILQRITGFHRIHHHYWSYGWKFPFLKVGYFPKGLFGTYYGFKQLKGRGSDYHNCTKTGIY
jgi:hypothetical protein